MQHEYLSSYFQDMLSDKLKTKRGLTLSFVETVTRSERNKYFNTSIEVAGGHFALFNFRILSFS